MAASAWAELWRNAGPSAFQLQENVLKVTKYDVRISWLTVPGYELFERASYMF